MDENMEKKEFEEMFRQVMKEHYPELHKPENKRLRAEINEKYWFVCHDGLIDYNVEENDIIDEGCYNRGNYFKTKEEAELYDKKRVITQKVKDIAIRLGEPTEEDWKDLDVSKHYIAVDLNKKMCVSHNAWNVKAQGAIYCLDETFLKVCLEEIGEEDLKLVLM